MRRSQAQLDPDEQTTLEEALRDADQHRWAGTRSQRRNYGQARKAVDTLHRVLAGKHASSTKEPVVVRTIAHGRFKFDILSGSTLPNVPAAELRSRGTLVGDVKRDHLKHAVRIWLADGLEPSTVGLRLNCLSVLGVTVKGSRPRLPRKLKWHLSDVDEAKLLPLLRASSKDTERRLADFIQFQTRVGMRVEETLRLEWSHVIFRGDRTLVVVPGTKTGNAQATLPVSEEVGAFLKALKETATGHSVFGLTYRQAAQAWRTAREMLGISDPKAATLKALRRSAARALHATKGMPLDMVRQYLRHSNVQTTMGYLRLTGGYGEEEMARWL